MPINAQIPLSVQPVQVQMPDPNAGMNALARAYQIKGAMAESDLNGLRMQETQRGIEDQNYLRNALSQPGADPYQAMMSRGMVKQATDFAKGQADLKKTQTDAQKAELEMGIKKAEHAASLFSLARDPQSYAVVRGLMKQQLGQDIQEQFDPNFVQAQMAIGQTITQKLTDLRKQQELAQKAVNDPFTVGPNGQPVANAPVQNFQLSKAKAGATNVSVNTDKSYFGNVAEGLAKNDVALIDAARSAPDRIASSRRVIELLDRSPITGTGAEARLSLNKALATAGIIDGTNVANTEMLASTLASQTLDAIKTSGLGSGQGFTDKDRQFLERAKSGNIEMNPQALRSIAELNDRAARLTIQRGNTVINKLRSNPQSGSMGQQLDPIQEPPVPSVVRNPQRPATGARFLGFE